ncbi:sodium:proton antiporter [Leptolyngbyaceae cyanobacterium CCMR0082]|uniref:Sodium:proton antiporter n=2 Tax=Adonisia turfae TaxID=2950184 RepID=A0A6M0S502_9CYAN|nr:sodium:proton antiporter [Adonisia turfae]MDV3350622.1 cation:proton antiporter [Leptothoe sp. LEGE 181152]NEZ55328.1 sodium:proton antiporter [Adonisia turfae CCMR0081]NEZ63466.1 sodium:proton antiporter [Adonisia turfae CCMR0082]
MATPFDITLQIVLAVLAGITAQVVAEYLRLPSIIFLLSFGVLLGPDTLQIIDPKVLGSGLEVIVSLCVALILFEGGLNLELKELGQVSGSLRNLITIGTFITLLGGGMAAHWFGEFPWPLAFLYGSLVVVTGPTVITPLLRQVQVEKKVATILEGEGVLIDPVGAILAVVVLDILLNGDTDVGFIVGGLAQRLSIGAVIGGVGGALLGQFLKRADFLSEELRNLVVLASVWGLFGLAQEVRSESGLMAAVTAGLVLRALSVPDERLLRRFKGQLTVFSVSVLFILLAADLSIDSVFALGVGSVFTVLALMLLVRPLNIYACTLNSDLNWRQKIFLSWIAPRGIVSASVASLFAILLTDRGINGGDSIKALVFLTIIMTVFIQGLTARSVAKFLGITQADATGVVIVGCNPVGRLVGRLFNQQGESVVMFDTDEEACELAKQDGLRVYLSSALDAELLDEAGLSSIGTFLALTTNGEVNSVVAERAAEEFQPPRVLAVLPRSDKETEPKANGKGSKVRPTPLAIKTWNTYLKDDAAELKTTQLQNEDFEKQREQLNKLITSGDLLPITVQRNGKLDVVLGQGTWQPGDTVTYLMHDPTPQLLRRLSGGKRTGRLVTDTLPPSAAPAPSLDQQSSATNVADAGETQDKPSGGVQTP